MKAEQVAKQVLADEYYDYKKNSWHYDRQYVMIIKAIKMYECLNGTEKTPIMQVREAFDPLFKGMNREPTREELDRGWRELENSGLDNPLDPIYKRDDLRDELIAFCCECNIELPRDKDYIDLVDGYLKTR